MDRIHLETIAEARLEDARGLLSLGRWAAAYYLTGYAVECGLKRCVLRHLGESGVVFGDPDYLKKQLPECWTHDLTKLVKLAGLEADFGTARQASKTLDDYWTVVKGWKETARYQEKTEKEARELFEAVCQTPDGVYAWIKSRW